MGALTLWLREKAIKAEGVELIILNKDIILSGNRGQVNSVNVNNGKFTNRVKYKWGRNCKSSDFWGETALDIASIKGLVGVHYPDKGSYFWVEDAIMGEV